MLLSVSKGKSRYIRKRKKGKPVWEKLVLFYIFASSKETGYNRMVLGRLVRVIKGRHFSSSWILWKDLRG